MSSEEYYASELSDDYLDAQADAGDYFLDESGFYFRLNSAQLSELVWEGELLLLCDKLLGKNYGLYVQVDEINREWTQTNANKK